MLTENRLNTIAQKFEIIQSRKVKIQFKIDHDIESYCFCIFSDDEFDTAQIGFRRDQEGKSLVGNHNGDWEDGWFVIGYEENLGDPLFVDTSDKYCPVLTAEKGLGEWEPSVLFDSFDEFIEKIKIE